MFDMVHIDTVKGLINDAFTRFVWAMTSKATTGFNYVNLIQSANRKLSLNIKHISTLTLVNQELVIRITGLMNE